MPPQFQEAIQANVSVVVVIWLACRCSSHSQCDRNQALSPISQTSLAIAVFGCQKVRWRVAASVYTYLTWHSIAHTACVMPSVDSIRRESHAATQDVFQPVMTQYVLLFHSINCKYFVCRIQNLKHCHFVHFGYRCSFKYWFHFPLFVISCTWSFG